MGYTVGRPWQQTKGYLHFEKVSLTSYLQLSGSTLSPNLTAYLQALDLKMWCSQGPSPPFLSTLATKLLSTVKRLPRIEMETWSLTTLLLPVFTWIRLCLRWDLVSVRNFFNFLASEYPKSCLLSAKWKLFLSFSIIATLLNLSMNVWKYCKF